VAEWGGGHGIPADRDRLIQVGQVAGALEPGLQGDTEAGQVSGSAGVVGRCTDHRLPQQVDGCSQSGTVTGPYCFLQKVDSAPCQRPRVTGSGDEVFRPPPEPRPRPDPDHR
jgi:hypothetical protein